MNIVYSALIHLEMLARPEEAKRPTISIINQTRRPEDVLRLEHQSFTFF